MGLNDQRQTAKNITDYRQNEKKNYRLPTGNSLVRRQPTWRNIWGHLYSKINRSDFFSFPFLSKVFRMICFQHMEGLIVCQSLPISDQRYVNHFKIPVSSLQEFDMINVLRMWQTLACWDWSPQPPSDSQNVSNGVMVIALLIKQISM